MQLLSNCLIFGQNLRLKAKQPSCLWKKVCIPKSVWGRGATAYTWLPFTIFLSFCEKSFGTLSKNSILIFTLCRISANFFEAQPNKQKNKQNKTHLSWLQMTTLICQTILWQQIDIFLLFSLTEKKNSPKTTDISTLTSEKPKLEGLDSVFWLLLGMQGKIILNCAKISWREGISEPPIKE